MHHGVRIPVHVLTKSPLNACYRLVLLTSSAFRELKIRVAAQESGTKFRGQMDCHAKQGWCMGS